MKTKFKNLFAPLQVRGVVFPNRIFLSPQNHSPKHKHPSSYEADYETSMLFFDKSRGGFGGAEIGIGPFVDGDIEKLNRDLVRELQSMCTQTGAKCGASIGGFMAQTPTPEDKEIKAYDIPFYGGVPKGAPKTIFGPQGPTTKFINYRASDGVWDGLSCFEMPKEMIYQSIENTAQQAKIAMQYDFDYVNVGGMAHGGALASFLSSKENHRTDEFGGSDENRSRYPLMLLQAVRDAVGPNVPIMMTISSVLYDERSYNISHTEDEMIDFLKRAQGLLDIVIISGGMDTTNLWNSNVFHCGTIFQKKAQELDFSKRVKQEAPQIISVPRGGMNEPEVMDEFIKNDWADAVCVGRQFVADPFWPKKAMENREEDIVPCIRCDHCYHSATDHKMLMCSVNPRLFRERRVPVEEQPTTNPQHLVVIGGGPGGCRAAITAAERGHKVTLIEKSDSLGGQLKHSVYDEHKTDLVRYMTYLRTQVGKHDNIEVMYNTTATPEMVEEMNPDAILVAIGAESIVPRIPGIEKAYEAVDVYSHQEKIGNKVVIIGGGTIGSELALHLAEHDHHVTIIEQGNELATKGHFFYKIGLEHAMLDVEDNWTALLNSSCLEIKDDGVVYKNADGEVNFVEADTVIYAVGLRSKKQEAQAFYGITPKTTIVGDCNRVGKVVNANTEAYFFAENL